MRDIVTNSTVDGILSAFFALLVVLLIAKRELARVGAGSEDRE